MVNTIKLTDVLRPGLQYCAEIGQQLGVGAQGQVFMLSRFDGVPGQHVLKMYESDPGSRECWHLVEFVRYIDSRPEMRGQPGLALPEFVVQDESSGKIGCILPFVKGERITWNNYQELHANGGLRGRLELALRLTESIDALHKNGVVAVDVNESNSFLVSSGNRIVLFDIDGGGVLAPGRADQYLPGLAPLVRGHFEDNFMAPELLNDAEAMPSIRTDLWALTNFSHKILMRGIYAFFGIEYMKVIKEVVTWPPIANETSQGQFIHFHRAELLRLGKNIGFRFMAVFSRGRDGAWHPALRPSALDWSRDLQTAINWVRKCEFCQNDFVSEGLLACPTCGSIGFHFRIQTMRGAHPVYREGQNLMAMNLGMSDAGGRYPLVTFHGRKDGLEMIAHAVLQERGTRRTYAPSESLWLDHRTKDRHFTARSRDGKTVATFQVCPPVPRLRALISATKNSAWA